MNITPENVVEEQHRQWLQHPTTIQMLKNLDEHKKTFINMSAKLAGDLSVSDSQFRLNAYGISTIDAIKHWVIDTNQFLKISKQLHNK